MFHAVFEKSLVHSNKAEATPESTESQTQLIKQVESVMASAWSEWKPALFK